ncbi:MAG TPA: tRNA preQ1(34) S-adenosylmethionine ribosyltransferase-isomerase QueA [Burkholderiales bacterium]|nr:tRNA preQ1(34) S-adenosylmethionine ribosyltransferase-isomerase QueA [Burkholderiales bacterium]
MELSDFDYDLPASLIAQVPLTDRGASRLMRLDGVTGAIADDRFSDFPRFHRKGDLLIFNDTRVIKARLFGKKDTGGRVEIMVDRILDNGTVLVMLRASRAPKAGQRIILEKDTELEIVSRQEDLFVLRFPRDPLAILDQYGHVPLPPYIERDAAAADESRYQTVYARQSGAVAAPTAGLHFDDAMLDRLKRMGVSVAYVTLHVGAGTFLPVRETDLNRHVMHAEWYSVPETTAQAVRQVRAQGGRICAVGTTSLRALESAARSDGEVCPGSAETRLFIRPGYRFNAVDRLLTNFHLPKSTLLMLVAAFAGLENVRSAYRHAVKDQYRFFSYGDAMLLDRAGPGVQSPLTQ